MGFPGGSVHKETACTAWDPGSISGWERSVGEGNGKSLQYSCLENPIDRDGGLQFMGLQRVGHNWVHTHTLTRVCIHTHTHTHTVVYYEKKVKQQDFPGGPVTGLCVPNARGLDSTPGQRTRSQVLQLRVCKPQLKNPECHKEDPVQPNKQINIF